MTAATWRCGACDTYNDADAERCMTCDTPREAPLPADGWRCPRCDAANDTRQLVCGACDAVVPLDELRRLLRTGVLREDEEPPTRRATPRPPRAAPPSPAPGPPVDRPGTPLALRLVGVAIFLFLAYAAVLLAWAGLDGVLTGGGGDGGDGGDGPGAAATASAAPCPVEVQRHIGREATLEAAYRGTGGMRITLCRAVATDVLTYVEWSVDDPDALFVGEAHETAGGYEVPNSLERYEIDGEEWRLVRDGEVVERVRLTPEG
ncbi:zinc finger protein [Streptomyces sp. 4N509B]|uniref:zinc finger protein n=1 Tax=Streptomyces sp. 4N509B TaxID=3457413 RepID=UPI003FD1DBAA